MATAGPTFEAAWRAAAWLEAPLIKVPLQPGKGLDVRAMLTADPQAERYYVCPPNSPTGPVTPPTDIEWLVSNKLAGSVVLVDEAYIHFSEVPSAAELAATRDDVVVMRTFSKLFGMAGIRLGLTFAAPALHDRMTRYDAVGLFDWGHAAETATDITMGALLVPERLNRLVLHMPPTGRSCRYRRCCMRSPARCSGRLRREDRRK